MGCLTLEPTKSRGDCWYRSFSCLAVDEHSFSGRRRRSKYQSSSRPACWQPPILVRYLLIHQWTLRPKSRHAQTLVCERLFLKDWKSSKPSTPGTVALQWILIGDDGVLSIPLRSNKGYDCITIHVQRMTRSIDEAMRRADPTPGIYHRRYL